MRWNIFLSVQKKINLFRKSSHLNGTYFRSYHHRQFFCSKTLARSRSTNSMTKDSPYSVKHQNTFKFIFASKFQNKKSTKYSDHINPNINAKTELIRIFQMADTSVTNRLECELHSKLKTQGYLKCSEVHVHDLTYLYFHILKLPNMRIVMPFNHP